MDNYPLGKDKTMALLFLAGLEEGSQVLCLGGMDSQLLVSRSGYKATRLKIAKPGRDPFLHCDYPENSFDGILSQGDLYVTGDMETALMKAASLLKKGGKLMMSELCLDDELDKYILKAGLEVESCEDVSAMWRAYYMDKLFAGEDVPDWLDRPFKYYTMVCRKI